MRFGDRFLTGKTKAKVATNHKTHSWNPLAVQTSDSAFNGTEFG